MCGFRGSRVTLGGIALAGTPPTMTAVMARTRTPRRRRPPTPEPPAVADPIENPILQRIAVDTSRSPDLSAGDLDAAWDADEGEETVGAAS